MVSKETSEVQEAPQATVRSVCAPGDLGKPQNLHFRAFWPSNSESLYAIKGWFVGAKRTFCRRYEHFVLGNESFGAS